LFATQVWAQTQQSRGANRLMPNRHVCCGEQQGSKSKGKRRNFYLPLIATAKQRGHPTDTEATDRNNTEATDRNNGRSETAFSLKHK